MGGLVPAIHVFASVSGKDVEARHKAGHDGGEAWDDSSTYRGGISPRSHLSIVSARKSANLPASIAARIPAIKAW